MVDLRLAFVDVNQPLENIAVAIPAGMVRHLDTGETGIQSVAVTSQPAFGRATVNPDNTVALVLTGTTLETDTELEVEITYSGGGTKALTFDVTVNPLYHGFGWSIGRAFKYKLDSNGRSIIPKHETTRTFYVTGSGAALTKDDIGGGQSSDAAAAAWLAANPGATEGASSGQAIDEGVALELWRDLQAGTRASTHMLFERGYVYDTFTFLVLGPTGGIDPMHPALIEAWGTGDRPEYTNISPGTNNNESTYNFVFRDAKFTGQQLAWRSTTNENIMFENCYFAKHEHLFDASNQPTDTVLGVTYRNCTWLDAFRDEPVGGTWNHNFNRISCFFANALTGLLLENCFLDKCGWDEGYDPDADPDPNLPQPPAPTSHPIYLSYDTKDVTLRNVTSMRSAATGVQLRPGGHVIDCLFMDNNDIANVSGGGEDDRANFTLFMGNVATSAGYREQAQVSSNHSAGIINQAILTTYTQNIIAHAADPNNPTEIAAKNDIQYAIKHGSTNAPGASWYHEDTKVYGWGPDDPGNQNLGGLNTATLDAATIQNYTAALTGAGSSILDYSTHMRALYAQDWDPAETTQDVINYFKTAFGVPLTGQARSATSMRFIPSDLCEGVRWDVRLNWSNGDIPRDGDSIDLAGNHTTHGSLDNLTITNLDFGNGGQHEIDCSYLEITGTITAGADGATLGLARTAQVWFAGYAGANTVTVIAAGGVLANTGDVAGLVDLEISEQVYVMFATEDGGDWAVDAGSIQIAGSAASVGFEGEGSAALSLTLGATSTLSYIGDSGGVSAITNLNTGLFDAPSYSSTVTLGGTLHLDVTDLANGTYTLIDVDTVSGTFASVTAAGNGSKDLTIAITGSTVTVQIADGSGGITGGT